jgi:hypothetical protein
MTGGIVRANSMEAVDAIKIGAAIPGVDEVNATLSKSKFQGATLTVDRPRWGTVR